MDAPATVPILYNVREPAIAPEYIRAAIPMDECAFNPVKGKVIDVNVTGASEDKLICEIREN